MSAVIFSARPGAGIPAENCPKLTETDWGMPEHQEEATPPAAAPANPPENTDPLAGEILR